MNWPSILLWGFAATAVLTTLARASQALNLSRMDIPFLLGTMFTPDRDLAKVLGFAFHFFNGWCFAILYALFFHALGSAGWLLGAAFGLFHAIFVLVALIPLLPGLHPRMASDFEGPDPLRILEPPGFLVMNYGYRTPLVTIAAHLVYGSIIGGFYQMG